MMRTKSSGNDGDGVTVTAKFCLFLNVDACGGMAVVGVPCVVADS